jgi:hypothetical protein
MLLAMAALLLALGGYAVLCAVKPFARCRRCQATGETTALREAPRPAPAAEATSTTCASAAAPTTPGGAPEARRRHPPTSSGPWPNTTPYHWTTARCPCAR